MIDQIFRLYKKTLPDIFQSDSAVQTILENPSNHIIMRCDGSDLIAVSVVNKNAIYLLCTDQRARNRGLGSELLAESEEYIFSNGYQKVVLGAGADYIMPGVPMNNNMHLFFVKRGYTHAWGDCGCFDMDMDLSDFRNNRQAIGDVINGIKYRWASKNDIGDIVNCVTDADESMVRWYKNRYLYEKGTTSPVLIAELNGEIVGTLIVGIVDCMDANTGSVGCTATAHRHRGKQIATNLITLATKHLQDIGCKRAYIGYTYTDLLRMYGRVGYKIYMEYFMGKKITEYQ